jgi:hypothetical protein
VRTSPVAVHSASHTRTAGSGNVNRGRPSPAADVTLEGYGRRNPDASLSLESSRVFSLIPVSVEDYRACSDPYLVNVRREGALLSPAG